MVGPGLYKERALTEFEVQNLILNKALYVCRKRGRVWQNSIVKIKKKNDSTSIIPEGENEGRLSVY